MKRIKTISEFHQYRLLPGPAHPLISVFQIDAVAQTYTRETSSWLYDFYCVALKRVSSSRDVKMKYGQQSYDYDNGIMSFVAPNQVVSLSVEKDVAVIAQSGWILLVHPDFLWNTPLAAIIKRYDFWDYSVHEALFLSDKEEATIIGILQNIQQECHANIDKFSKNIIISQLESFLHYADRFYHRQFITREKANHHMLERVEQLLNDYFNSDALRAQGLPTVQFIAQSLHVSPKYLSSLLRVQTGRNTQQHIHEKLIEKAKEQLSTTALSVSEIAYALGFEHLQSFSKLFKMKTSLSPLEFRALFG